MSIANEFFSLSPKYRTKGTLLNMVYALEKALNYAVEIIESYELDCRNLKDYLKKNSIEGFCQGTIYKDALNDIKKIMEEK